MTSLSSPLYIVIIALLLVSCSQGEEEPQPMIVDTQQMDDPMMDDDMMDNDMMDDMMDDPMMDEPTSEFEAAPAFEIQTTDGDTLSLDQFEDKVLVLFFFGAECPPCRRVGPDVESMVHQSFINNDNFAIIGADQWDRNDASVIDFVHFTGITFPVGRLGSTMAADYGTTFDRMVILNRDSEIVYRSPGRVSGLLDEAISIIEDLL